MSEQITGPALSLTMAVGRADVLEVKIGGDAHPGRHYFSAEADADVICDGRKVTVGGLFDWLVVQNGTVTVALTPLTERYGLSLRTEFSHGS